jgi:NAD(P)-dependent dehydrogenase (short-subunit alcohol dehydrogenase family)
MRNRYMKMKEKALEGKVAIVTGGASGIGEAVGRIFLENGCKVILVDKNKDRLEKVVNDIAIKGSNCKGVYADVSVESKVIKLFQDAMKDHGRVDILVNSAGRDSLSPPIIPCHLPLPKSPWRSGKRQSIQTSKPYSYAVERHLSLWKNRAEER